MLPQKVEQTDLQESRKDIRVIVRVKNALILRKMEELGIKSVAELSRLCGINHMMLGTIINMKRAARRDRNYEWGSNELRLANFFKCLPEDIFSEQQQRQGLKKNTAYRDVTMQDIKDFFIERDQEESPEQVIQRKEALAILEGMVSGLQPRTRKILTLRFGLDGKGERTLEATIKELGLDISRGRLQQIEVEGLRKLKKTAVGRVSSLRDLMNGGTK